jgi:hypothetical protein
MSRLLAVVAAFGSLSLGCGGEDPSSSEEPVDTVPEGSETPDTAVDVPTDPEWGLEFALTGHPAPMTARAELKVVEGERPVHLAINGRTPGTDFVMIDLTFDSIEDAIGTHRVEFSLPMSGAHFANTSLDDNWYYSQGGEIDVSVSADGPIEGSFDIALAHGVLAGPGEPVLFTPSDVTTPLEGRFSGSWVLNCHSRLQGHTTLIFGGDYCDALVIAGE